ncbi:hypothetical protein D3C78_1537720 [compost metagenome]
MRGQRDLAAGAVEQHCLVVLFELLHLPADGALGQVQLPGGFGEVAGVGDPNQGLQCLQRGNTEHFIHAFSEWMDDFLTLESGHVCP